MSKDNQSFAFKAAAFNAIGYCLQTGIATYVDARLTSYRVSGERHYALGYWVLLFGLAVFLATYALIRMFPHTRIRTILPSLPVVIIGCAVLPNFKPEMPHMGILGYIMLYSVTTFVYSYIHYAKTEIEAVGDERIVSQARVEMVKEAMNFWRMLALGIGGGYLSILVSWISFIWSSSDKIASDVGQQLLLGQSGQIPVYVVSAYVGLGPVAECLRKVRQTAKQFARITVSNAAAPTILRSVQEQHP